MTVKMKHSRDKNSDSQNEGARIQIFVQQMLVTRIFAASYVNRSYVESLKAYRDVIQIFEEEKDLIKDLEIIKKRVDTFYKGAIWAAVTVPGEIDVPSGHCIWAKLENVAFGGYWFTIEDTNFSDNGEVVIKLKVIRHFEPDVKASISTEKLINWNEIKSTILEGLCETITWYNVKESSKFLFALLMTVGAALLYSLQYLGEYSLKLFREFNNLLKVLTPVFLGILDLVSKIIGGFYILIAMLWRGQAPNPVAYPGLMAPPTRQNKQVKYPPHQRQYYNEPVY